MNNRTPPPVARLGQRAVGLAVASDKRGATSGELVRRESGDHVASPTDDAAPEGEPTPDAAPLPPPPVPAFLEGVSAPTEPVAPNAASEPSAVEELPAAAPPPPAAAPVTANG